MVKGIILFLLLHAFAQALDVSVITDLEYSVTSNFASSHVQFFKIWIPINSKDITIHVSNNNQNECNYVLLSVKSQGFPCDSQLYPVNNDYVCSEAKLIQNILTENTLKFDASSEEYVWVTNNWLYFTLSKPADSNDVCSFNLTATIEECPDGQAALDECVAFTDILSAPFRATFPSVSVPYRPFRIVVPQNVSQINVTATIYHHNTSSNFDLLFRQYAPPLLSSYQAHKPTYTNSGGNLTFEYTWHNPRSGDLWFALYDDQDSNYGMVVDVTWSMCNSETAGVNCAYPAHLIEDITSGSNIVVPASTGLPFQDSFVFYSFYVPPRTEGNINITAKEVQTSNLNMFIRRDGFIWDSDIGHEYLYQPLDGSTFHGYRLRDEDLWVGGQWYVGVLNENGVPGTATIQVQYEVRTIPPPVTTTSASTAGGTTGAEGESSDASKQWEVIWFGILVSFGILWSATT